MVLKRWVVAAALVAPNLFAPSVVAQCETSTLLEIDLVAAKFYYDDRSELPPVPGFWWPMATWIYEETNDAPSLQRGGREWLPHAVGAPELNPEICIETGTPDKLWY